MSDKKKKGTSALSITMISIGMGIVLGGIILAVAGYSPFRAYWVIIAGIFGRLRYVSYSIIKATPLIITGLSVAFAFRTGLFNIGAEGQFIVGALAAVLVGVFIPLPFILHVPLVFLAGTAAGMLWGGLSGGLKARFGVNEVISTIMLNWVALYLNNYLIKRPFLHRPASEASYKILDSARIDLLPNWKVSEAGLAFRKTNPVLGDLLRSEINLGIIIALGLAFLVWFIIHRTTLGYELRSVGLNPSAAEYGGINVKRSMVTSMGIAGGLAGAAGAIQVMGVTQDVTVLAAMEGFGFDGIAVALIGANTPLGCVLAGLLFGALKYGGIKIQPALGAPKEIVNIVIGSIVFFIAIPSLIMMIRDRIQRKRG